ncbi:MAG: AAA family ATPase [Caldilineaceae bacterium]
MVQLSLTFLGSFDVNLNGAPVTGFRSDKARALLAYLAVESIHPHERAKVAGLLWPDYAEAAARTYLRHALANLRRLLAPANGVCPFLATPGDAIHFQAGEHCRVDVALLTERLAQLRKPTSPNDHATQQALADLMALYRGPFLDGFGLADSDRFEEWLILTRERLQRQVVEALQTWVTACVAQGRYAEALPVAQRCVELEPTHEEAQRQLIYLLALLGQRSAALIQFERCRQVLEFDLAVAPAAETLALVQRIQDDALALPQPAPRIGQASTIQLSAETHAALPPFLAKSPRRMRTATPVVARADELARLFTALESTCRGEGAVLFVTGDAGAGKTALLQEFAHQAQQQVHELVVATGNCNAHTGIGDPYLPFCEILALLTGDIEARWLVGALPREEALRLWQLLPHAVQALVEDGPGLVDTFLSAPALLTRAELALGLAHPHLLRLQQLAAQRNSSAGVSYRQSELFSQYTHLLQTVGQTHPLLLIVDDLQWADVGSLNLLFHLGRQLAGSRILLVGAYRPTDVAQGRDGARHPLELVVHELMRTFGDAQIDLNQVDGHAFVNALIDSEPNQLNPSFRQTLYTQTAGHPLFTVELLRGMQVRGDLIQTADGCWVTGAALDWETLPARVEAVIGERINRLPDRQRELLKVASVEGEFFTAEVLARLLNTSDAEVLRLLSSELDRRHRLVRAQSIERLAHQRLSHYRFGHILFQKYLYSHLDAIERASLHEQIGDGLEALYHEQPETVAGALARHFEEAGIVEKAIFYLRMAGNHALHLSANEEAIIRLTRARTLLQTLPVSQARKRLELDLCLLVGPAFMANRGYAAPEVLEVYDTAYQLCQEVGNAPQQLQALWGLRGYYHVRGRYHRSLELSTAFMALVESARLSHLLGEAHRNLGTALLHLGEFPQARMHLERAVALYDARQHREYIHLYGQDTGVAGFDFLAIALWMLGYPDQALQATLAGLDLAKSLEHPFTLAYALNNVQFICQYCGNMPLLQTYTEATLSLSREQGFKFWISFSLMVHGWTLAQLGQVDEGLVQFHAGLDLGKAIGSNWGRRYFLSLLTDIYRMAGQLQMGMRMVLEALEGEANTDDFQWETELYRLKGELLLAQSTEATQDEVYAAEAAFRQALQIARRQQAKSLELRAAMSLARLWQSQGKRAKAHALLAPIYAWFTEGFDTHDLREAKALLERLAEGQAVRVRDNE